MNMRWLLGLCVLICFCAATSARDDQASDRTLRLANGRYWNSLPESDETRAVFVVGIIDGWELDRKRKAPLGAVYYSLSLRAAELRLVNWSR